MWEYLLYFFLFPSLFGENNELPVVTTQLGKIRGTHKLSFEGKTFSSFEGIPYAKPPIGELRFKEPQAIEPWEGVWEANVQTECLQYAIKLNNTIHGQEDCLYLNVYVPRSQPDPNEKLDVIVHIHGGGFHWGSGSGYSHPEYFMDRDVVLVTFNYRLGFLGFLSTEDDVVPGNNGLKDQTMALQWIKDNIAGFGGNPDSVTLTGLSAGGASVHFHYLSPKSKGLFHRGFSQSGVALNPWALQEAPLEKAKRLAASVGCPTENTESMIKCLRERPAQQLILKMPLFYHYKFLPVCPFAPVLEKGPDAFISKNPFYLLGTGKINDLPWITSNTAHEGLFPGAYIAHDLEEINKRWNELAPMFLEYNYTVSRAIMDKVSETIKKKYFGEDQDINAENFDKLVQVFSDRLFLVDSEKAARLQANSAKSPVYYFYFSFPMDHNADKTVAHGEDAQYLFHKMFGKDPSPNEIKMKDIMLDMLTSFAKNNKPVIDGVNWEPADIESFMYLEISSPEKMELKEIKELAPKMFWKSLGFLENDNLVMLMKDEL